jgi:hypothetical protein
MQRRLFDRALKKGEVYVVAMAAGRRISSPTWTPSEWQNLMVFDGEADMGGQLVMALSGGQAVEGGVHLLQVSQYFQLYEGTALRRRAGINFNDMEILDSILRGHCTAGYGSRQEGRVFDLSGVPSGGVSPYRTPSNASSWGFCYPRSYTT